MCKPIISSFLDSCLLLSCHDVLAVHAASWSLLIILPLLTPSSLLHLDFTHCILHAVLFPLRFPPPTVSVMPSSSQCFGQAFSQYQAIEDPSYSLFGLPFVLSLFYSCRFRCPSCRPMLMISLSAGHGDSGEACQEDGLCASGSDSDYGQTLGIPWTEWPRPLYPWTGLDFSACGVRESGLQQEAFASVPRKVRILEDRWRFPAALATWSSL